jgi:hypothetical protein
MKADRMTGKEKAMEKHRKTPMVFPSLAEAEKAVGSAAAKWKGRCYEVSCKLVEAGLVEGVPVYGHYLGYVGPESFFGTRAGMPFVRRGWVLLPDGRVFDPTRWVFEDEEPYLYVGVNVGEYDEGGNTRLRATKTPVPPIDYKERVYALPKHLSAKAKTFVFGLLGYGPLGVEMMCFSHVHWLAHVPHDELAPHAAEIYGAIEAVGQRASVPLDNWRRAVRETPRRAPGQAGLPRTGSGAVSPGTTSSEAGAGASGVAQTPERSRQRACSSTSGKSKERS